MGIWNGISELSGTIWATLIGAVAGSVTGGIINLLIQSNGVRIARVERLAAKRQENLATAFSVMVKIIKMLSGIGHIKAEIAKSQAALDSRRKETPNTEFWQVLPPFGTLPRQVEFTNTECALILSTKNPDLMLAAIELCDIYNDLIDLISLYSDRREALTASFNIEELDGSYGSSYLDEEQKNQLMPRIIQLRSLTKAMVDRIYIDYDQAEQVFGHFKNYCSKQFDGDFPSFEIDAEKFGPATAP